MTQQEGFTWKHIPSPEELMEMHPIARSKFLAYMEPPPGSKQLIHRIIIRMRKERIQRTLREQSTLFREHEKEKVNIVIGRLKAAEARQRIHVVLMNLNNKIDKKLDQLVYVQPTGVNAVRTEYLVRNRPLDYLPGGRLNPVKDQKEFYLTLSEKTRLARIMDEKIL